MRKIAEVALAVFVVAGIAPAQVPTSGNIFVGYSFSRGDIGSGDPAPANLNGWEGSLEGKFLPWIGIVADLSGHYGSQTELVGVCAIPCGPIHLQIKRYTFLFGPRVSIPVGRFTPFAQAVFGAGHITNSGSGFSDSDTSFATAIGGGLDYKIVKGLAWRLQGDDLHTRFFGGRQNHFRLSTGIVFRF